MNHNLLVENFLEVLASEKGLSSNTLHSYKNDLDQFIDFIQKKNLELTKFKDRDINEFVSQFKDRGYERSTIARKISSLTHFFKFLLDEKEIKINPLRNFEIPKKTKKLPIILSSTHIDKILEFTKKDRSVPGIRLYTMIEILYATGIRVSELVEMKLSSVYEDKNFLLISGKGNKERLAPIGNAAIKLIKEYITEYRNNQNIKKGSEDILFLNRRGSQLTRVMIFTIVKKIAKSAGIKKNISPHTFRHSFASHLLEGGADLRIIQDILGHENITTTEIYTHLDKEFIKEAILQFHPRSK